MDLVSPITAVVTRVVDCSSKHLNYLRALGPNLNQLEEEMAQLNERKSDINNKVIAEEAQLKKRTNQVDGWMQRVEAKGCKVAEILLEGRQLLQKRCLGGCCPKNCWSSYKLGKKVAKNLELVKELNSKGVFEIVAEKPHRTRFQELPEYFTVGIDTIFEVAMNRLGKDDVQVLGLYGVGGVGKTTLLKKFNNELPKRTNDFDIVIWMVISSEVNMGTVQESIRERLGLISWPESVPLSSRASDIFDVLKEMQFLLLLDDVWKKIDLVSIGIPLPSVQNKSKIILTTRSLDVCRSMEADDTIKVKFLNQEQSWVLFQNKVGQQTLNADSEIPKLAKEVAKKCHGLPIVLITVGASMASKTNPREWNSAILDLNKSAAKFPGMEELVFHLLKFSYDKLPSSTHQECFLFCALYSKDGSIYLEDLIQKWIGAGYINGFEDYEEALNKGHSIIGTLKRACLLENLGDGNVAVKMHDVIQDLALWITCECGREEGKAFVKSGHALSEKLIINFRPTVVQKISLIDTNITHLENLPSCPNLSIFFAPQNECLNYIIDDFFLSMPTLKFLDLSFCGITRVPSSICELFELEFLNLSDTKITSLPYEMRNLTKLKYLSFSGTKQLQIIPRGMMSNFSNLEILKLHVPKSSDSDDKMHVNIEELQCSNQLKALDISISGSKDLEKFISDPRLCNCTRSLRVQWCKEITLRLSLGHFKQLGQIAIGDCSELKELFFYCITNNDEIEVGSFESLEEIVLDNLPKLVISWNVKNLHRAHFIKLHSVFLDGCDAMVDLTWLLLVPNLQTLWIYECNGLEEILTVSNESGGAYDKNIFSNLKFLRLHDLPNLQSICSMSALTFSSLQTIFVRRCPKLKRLPLDSNSANNTLQKIDGDSIDWWNGLEWENETIKTQFKSHLFLNVWKERTDCGGLQEILSSSDEFGRAYDQNTFSNPKVLYINELPILWFICSMNTLTFPSLKTIYVHNCTNLRRLPLDSNGANNTLKRIQGNSMEWWDRLEWEGLACTLISYVQCCYGPMVVTKVKEVYYDYSRSALFPFVISHSLTHSSCYRPYLYNAAYSEVEPSCKVTIADQQSGLPNFLQCLYNIKASLIATKILITTELNYDMCLKSLIGTIFT